MIADLERAKTGCRASNERNQRQSIVWLSQILSRHA
jgi:hypothetical protein